jgi:glycosyltransferase involved in cell wall biosynthesis
MRIVHVAPFYTPIIGGVEEVVRKIAEYTASRGYETHVVTYNRLRNGGIGSLPREEEINGVHVIRLKPDLTWSNGTYSSELPQVIRRLKPDIVHIHVWRHPHVFQVARLRRELKFKAVLHGHAPFYNLSQSGLVTWIYYKLIDMFGRDYLKAYDIYIALTPYEVNKVKALGFSNNVVIIPNGIHEDKCPYNNVERKDNMVLYLGRISKSKNIDLLIKAMIYVTKSINNIELIMAGPDERLAQKYVRYAKRSNMKTRYIGQVSEMEKHRLYLESMVYTLPSLYEGFGLTLLEAGIHGTPSVITGEGGQVYAAPPNKASLWAKPNPKDYANAITTLLMDRELWKKLSQGAREWAQQHTWNKILPKYEKLYNELTR